MTGWVFVRLPVLSVAVFPVLDLAGFVHGVGRLCLVACSGGYRRGKLTTPATLRGSSPVLGSSGCSSPMVSGVAGWPVLPAGMAKATSWGLLVAFGALCALGVYGFIRWGISSCSSWPCSVVVV